MKKVLFVILSLSIVFMIAGCTKNNDSLGFQGEITEITFREGNIEATILVEGELAENVAYDKAYVTITKETAIVKKAGNKKLSVSDLKEGLKVEGVFEGDVAESYPVQGTAKFIRVVE